MKGISGTTAIVAVLVVVGLVAALYYGGTFNVLTVFPDYPGYEFQLLPGSSCPGPCNYAEVCCPDSGYDFCLAVEQAGFGRTKEIQPGKCWGYGSTNAAINIYGAIGEQPQICTPNYQVCNGNILKTCNSEGTAWESTVTCPVACQMITETQGRCVECMIGQNRCLGNQPQVCDAYGQWTDNGEMCSASCIDGACTTCSPGEIEIGVACGECGKRTCQTTGTWGSCEMLPNECSDSVCMLQSGKYECVSSGTECGNGICEFGETYENCPSDCEPGEIPEIPGGSNIWMWFILFLAVVIIAVLLIKRK